MRTALPILASLLVLLALAGCQATDPDAAVASSVAGTWTLKNIANSNNAWASASSSGYSGTITFAADSTFSGTLNASTTAYSFSGTWTNSGTMISLLASGDLAGVFVGALAADVSTLTLQISTGGFQYTK